MRTVHRLVIVLALCIGGSSSAFAGDEPRLKDLFFASDYSMCDAHFVAKNFEMDTSSAKAYIGQKIGWGTPASSTATSRMPERRA
jgi:hypothetical protein